MAAQLESLRVPRPRARERTHPRWRSLLGWSTLGGVALLLTLAATWPATWVATAIAERTGQRVILADASGTLWRGAATLALGAGPESHQATVLPGRLHWQLSALALLRGRAVIDLNHDTALPAAVRFTVTPAGWQSGAGVLTLPAALLQGIGAPFNTLQPEGRMQISWNPLSGTLGQGIRDGDATVRLDQLASNLSPIRPLGSYLARLRWQDGNGSLTLATLDGPLLLDGAGTLGRNARFEGTARATPEAATALNALLSLMGRREGTLTRLRF
ncbi:type II secretion system protein N [Imbroritus primus]|uniref:type II secretion system protein N n=1 Tax=Imbroritus primus TaxID=3058603 RepID=UPI003D16111B